LDAKFTLLLFLHSSFFFFFFLKQHVVSNKWVVPNNAVIQSSKNPKSPDAKMSDENECLY
jgi:hypothetical protein